MKRPEIPETSLPLTFAVLKDGRRRGGFRVARCRVVTALEGLDVAAVREIRTRADHWRPFDALAKHPRRAGRILRELLTPPTLSPAPEEAQSAAVDPLAGTAGAGEVTHDRANGYVPEPAEICP